MTKAQKTFEREFSKEKILAEDFQKILADFDTGDQCVLDFSKTLKFDSETDVLKKLVEDMISKSSNLVIIGPECFEEVVSGINNQKFHFILKSFSTPDLQINENWQDLINKVSEEFFSHYFASVMRPEKYHIESFAVATVDLNVANSNYQFGIVMDEKMLQQAMEKVLFIPVDPALGDCKDLAAEVLNMMCGNLRSRLRQGKDEIKMGIPKCIMTHFKFPPDTGKFWVLQEANNQIGLFLTEGNNNVCA